MITITNRQIDLFQSRIRNDFQLREKLQQRQTVLNIFTQIDGLPLGAINMVNSIQVKTPHVIRMEHIPQLFAGADDGLGLCEHAINYLNGFLK